PSGSSAARYQAIRASESVLPRMTPSPVMVAALSVVEAFMVVPRSVGGALGRWVVPGRSTRPTTHDPPRARNSSVPAAGAPLCAAGSVGPVRRVREEVAAETGLRRVGRVRLALFGDEFRGVRFRVVLRCVAQGPGRGQVPP